MLIHIHIHVFTVHVARENDILVCAFMSHRVVIIGSNHTNIALYTFFSLTRPIFLSMPAHSDRIFFSVFFKQTECVEAAREIKIA